MIITDEALGAISDPPRTAQYATGTDILVNDDTIKEIPSTSYQKLKQITVTKIVPNGSTLNIYFELSGQADAGGGDGYAKIYINGVARGAERVVSNTDAFSSFESNLVVHNGDTVELWGKWARTGGGAVRNFRIRGNPSRDCFRAHADVV